MRTAFITFVYPGAEGFFDRFIRSLKNQTDKEFTLIIFNDGCEKSQLNCFYKQVELRVNIIDNRCNSIGETRFRACELLANSKYSNFIFGDIDDVFSENRVYSVKKALLSQEIVFNDLHLTNKEFLIVKPNLIKNFLGITKEVDFEMIKYKNLIGFSHLAMRKEAIQYLKMQQINTDIKIVDWIIVTKLLTRWNAYFEANAITYYMMHEDNIALDQIYDYNSFLKEVDIKYKHYKETSNLSKDLARELEYIHELKTLIIQNKITKDNWRELVLNEDVDFYPWWNKLKYDEEPKNEIQIRRN